MVAIIALLIINTLPQEYINMVLMEDYESAAEYCKKMMEKSRGFKWYLELGDLYFDKLDEPLKAKQIYQEIIEKYPQKDGWVYYRLGLVLEVLEDYLNAARTYEKVATRYRTPPLDSFSLSGVERCFKKNYQDTVALVDGYQITRLELDERMLKQSPFAKKDERGTLDQMILERLLYVHALKNNVKAMKEYKDAIKQTRINALLDEVRAIYVLEKADPSEKEMRSYYNKNKHFYKLSKEVRGKEIVVESESLAILIRDSLLKDPASFDTLAKLHSTAPTKGGGGEMGIVIPGTKPKEVEDVLFSIELNKISDIVKFDNKFGIYIVNERKPERWRSYNEVKSQVEAAVRAEKIQKLEEKFLKDLKAKAKIEIFKDSIITDTALKSNTRIVAVVNGRPIKFQDVENKNASQPMFARLDISRPEEFEKVLESLIEENLKLEVAERNKYFLYDGFITKYLEGVRRALEQALYTKIVIQTVKVDSQEVIDYYQQHKEDMKIPETIRCKEIVLYKKEEAEKIRSELAKHYGEKKSFIPFLSRKAKITDFTMFDSLAKTYSTAYNKSRGGDTGPLKKGSRPKEFEDVAWKLKIGELSKVFLVGDSSWTILTKTEHTPTRYRTLDEVKASIEMNLLREKQRKTADDFLAKIKNEAVIEIRLPEPVKEEEKESGAEETQQKE
ncbi:MAG: peptidylprolyl isomerase [candidate division WOR-3 bacterium]|nr:peptidylprolyl isomerase [candidate division WOR-3 bacterium]